MLDLNHLLTNVSADVQYYEGQSSANLTDWQVWRKPRNSRLIYILGAGGGSSGSTGGLTGVPTLVRSQSSSSVAVNAVAITPATANLIGSLLIVTVVGNSSSAITMGDTNSNTYTAVDTVFDATSGFQVATFYIANIANTNTLFGATFGGTMTTGYIIVDEYSGMATSSTIDGHSMTTALTGSGATDNLVATSITPTVIGDLLYSSVFRLSGSGTITAGSGFTLTNSFAPLDSEAQIVTTPATVAPTWSNGTNGDKFIVATMAFKVAPVSSGAGGGSGAVSTVLVPAMFVPDVLYVQAGQGGIGPTALSGTAGAAGQPSYVCIEPDKAAQVPLMTLLFANPGAAAVSFGTAGAAAAAATLANMPLAGKGLYNFYAGQAGASGATTPGHGTGLALPTTGILLTGGTSGGSGANNGGGSYTIGTGGLGNEWFGLPVGVTGQGDSGTVTKIFNFGGVGGGQYSFTPGSNSAIIPNNTLGISFNGTASYAFRNCIAGAAFTGSSKGWMRFTFLSGTSVGLVTTHCSVALVGGASAPSTTLKPVEITFNGGQSGFSILATSTTITSDWIPFAFNAATDTIMIELDCLGTGTQSVAFATSLGASYNGYYKLGGSGDYASNTVSGYTSNSGDVWGLQNIETLDSTQLNGGNGGPGSGGGGSSTQPANLITKVQTNTVTGGSGGSFTNQALSFGAAVGANNAILGTLSFTDTGSPAANSTTISVTDDKSNVYTIVNSALPDTGGFDFTYQFYCLNVNNAPTTVTAGWKFAEQAHSVNMTIDEFSGIGSFTTSNNVYSASGTTPSGGSVTTLVPKSLIYSTVSCGSITGGNTPTFTAGRGYVITGNTASSSASFLNSLATQYKLQTTASSNTPSFTLSSSTSAYVASMVFAPFLSNALNQKAGNGGPGFVQIISIF